MFLKSEDERTPLSTNDRLIPDIDDVVTVTYIILKKISKLPCFVNVQKTDLKFDIDLVLFRPEFSIFHF